MTARTITLWIAGALVLAIGVKTASDSWAAPQEPSAGTSRGGTSRSGEPRIEEPIPGLMLAKLASSQAIVAGLVSKDFDQIRRGAKDMVRICDASEWEGNTDEVYAHHRRELRRQAIKLNQMAQDQNLDGAAYIYTQTVSTCITCHQHCRDVLRIAERSRPQSGVIRIPVAEDDTQWQTNPQMRR